MSDILVLGASGMLGHKIVQVLSNDDISVAGTVRRENTILNNYEMFTGVNVENFSTVSSVIDAADPMAVINCIGIIKQLPESNDPIKSHTINSVFPHQLATYCESKHIRLIHVSTDCVFDGVKGNYKESDIPNATDIYGRTKFTGEITYPHLTLRTSIIGRELNTNHGLVEWFLSNKNKTVNGFTNAIFSGVTTIELANVIENIIFYYPELQGLYHVAADPISKFDLLQLINVVSHNNSKIIPHGEDHTNRSLDSSKLKSEMGDYEIPSWEYMIEEMISDRI